MENYKVKVGSEAESKEVQGLFFELGGGWGSGRAVVENTESKCLFLTNSVCITHTPLVDNCFYKHEAKELTISQLKDIVVLKRNDVGDATHGGAVKQKLLKASSGWYIFNTLLDVWEWNGEYLGYQPTELKPITKEPVMKEFLNPDQGYKLVYCAIGETPIPENWIEVPEGATSYNQYTRGESDDEFFIKLVGDTYCFANEDTSYMWEWYGGSLKGHEFVLWQRETLNDKVASAEVARQEFIGVPFSEWAKVNFEAVDDFVESNVEQDNVNQPSHYCSHPSGIECIEITRHHDFTIGNAIKYLWRAGLKDSADEIQDLEKASWYIQDKINQLKKLNETGCKD